MRSLPDVGVIDLMMGLKAGANAKAQYDRHRAHANDPESKAMAFPAEYMFKDVPYSQEGASEPPQGWELVIPEMDRHGIERAMIGVGKGEPLALDALERFPERFFASYDIDPNLGMDGVRLLEQAHQDWGIKAATFFASGCHPQVPINDKKAYPFYAKCVELGIPIFVNAGIPGPRFPYAAQHVGLLDEVCYDFPELTIVTRHGCEPWADLAVKLMLKWPNLYYSTSAFAPRYYPDAIVEYANTRGQDKVLYAGYFPMGLSLDRIFGELPGVPFSAEVWPKFLRENAMKVLDL